MLRLITSALLLALTLGASLGNRTAVADGPNDDRMAQIARKVVEETKEAVATIQRLCDQRKRTLEVVKRARVRPGQTVARYARGDRERQNPIAVIYGSQEDKEAGIREWEQRVAAMESELKRVSEQDFFFGYLPNKPTVGDFGHVRNVEVLQVIGPGRMLVVYGGDVLTGQTLLVEGVDTTGVVDDDRLNIEPVMEVTGTHRYNSALGAVRTVLKLEPMDLDPIREYIRQHKLMEQ